MNKKILSILLLMICISFLCAAVSFAQQKVGQSIFEYKKELSLTDDQEKNLRDIIAKLQAYLADSAKQLDQIRADLSKMITDKSDLYKIRAKLRAMAQVQADASYEDIASSRAIVKELTAAQMSTWRNIQEEFRKKQQEQQAKQAKNNTAK